MSDADTPFVRMLQHYMWRERTPPINPNKLATELGVSRTTVANWLNGTKPVPEIVPELAAKLGLPVEAVMDALGYPVVIRDTQGNAERIMRLALEVMDEFATLKQRFEQDKDMKPAERQAFRDQIEELTKRVERVYQEVSKELNTKSDESHNDEGDVSPKASAAAMG